MQLPTEAFRVKPADVVERLAIGGNLATRGAGSPHTPSKAASSRRSASARATAGEGLSVCRSPG